MCNREHGYNFVDAISRKCRSLLRFRVCSGVSPPETCCARNLRLRLPRPESCIAPQAPQSCRLVLLFRFPSRGSLRKTFSSWLLAAVGTEHASRRNSATVNTIYTVKSVHNFGIPGTVLRMSYRGRGPNECSVNVTVETTAIDGLYGARIWYGRTRWVFHCGVAGVK